MTSYRWSQVCLLDLSDWNLGSTWTMTHTIDPTHAVKDAPISLNLASGADRPCFRFTTTSSLAFPSSLSGLGQLFPKPHRQMDERPRTYLVSQAHHDFLCPRHLLLNREESHTQQHFASIGRAALAVAHTVGNAGEASAARTIPQRL